MKRFVLAIKNNIPYILPSDRLAGVVPIIPEKVVFEGKKTSKTEIKTIK